ncbi:MAG: hypothetical protein HYU36_19600 [Planctomycetes bacterium]|nr:hypothetical protein [Planctomycetota bacterium]
MWTVGLDEYPYGQAPTESLKGIYTLRLTVLDTKGKTASHSIQVNVARVLPNWMGGYGESPDGVVKFELTADSLTEPFVLVSILPTTTVSAPQGTVQVGAVYEFHAPGLGLLRPAKMIFKFEAAALSSVSPASLNEPASRLSIYSHSAKSAGWMPIPSSVDSNNHTVSSDIAAAQANTTLYGLFLDIEAPAPPALAPLPERVQSRLLAVRGTGESGSHVVVHANEKSVQARCGTQGDFELAFQLEPGANRIQAACVDLAGNPSAVSPALTVNLEYRHPRLVRECRLLGTREAARGSRLLVKLVGEDSSEEVDTTLVRVFSSLTDPLGMTLEAFETGARTGTYVAVFQVGEASDGRLATISAVVDREEIVTEWCLDDTKRATKTYRDRIGPDAPRIVVQNEAVLCWDDFDSEGSGPAGRWQPIDTLAGGRLSLESEHGNTFLSMQPSKKMRSHLGVCALKQRYSLREFPILSFYFRCSDTVGVDLLVHLAEPPAGWRGIELYDAEPYYPRIGRFWPVPVGSRWHRCQVNLFRQLHERYPDLADFVVDEVAFADWDGGDRLFGTKYPGYPGDVPGIQGGFYHVDNFFIGNCLSSEKAAVTWTATDRSGIDGYSLVMDRDSTTVPSETVMQEERGPQATGSVPHEATPVQAERVYERLADGLWWFHVRARDRSGNWGRTAHYPVPIDTKGPSLQQEESSPSSVEFEQGIRRGITDVGTGVDPDDMVLELDRRWYRVDGRHLNFDSVEGVLTFRSDQLPGRPVSSDVPSALWGIWFVDGAPMHCALRGVYDYAGNQGAMESGWALRAISPLVASGVEMSPEGWFRKEPQLGLRPGDEGTWALAWTRTLNGDKYAEKGCFIREVAVVQHDGVSTHGAGQSPIPILDPEARVRFSAEIRVDTTAPRTRLEVVEEPLLNGRGSPPTIRFAHEEYAYRRGGLLGTYFSDEHLRDAILERIDPFVYFHDERERYTARIPGAKSAAWEGAVYMSKTAKVVLELAIWKRAPARGRVLIDGDAILELSPEQMNVIGYKRQEVWLVEGLHELRLEFSDPMDRDWQFALFHWGIGKHGEDVRMVFGPGQLYYRANAGVTYYGWDEVPLGRYEGPIRVPFGKHLLRFYTCDLAGNREEEQTREFNFAETIPGPE